MDDPFDESAVLSSFEALSPYRRGVVAALAAYRAGVFADFPDIDQYFSFAPGYAFLIEDTLRTLDQAIVAGQVDSAEAGALKGRFVELLGPDGEEYEEPEDWVPACYVNAASIVDHALRTWAEAGESQANGFQVLSDIDAFTAALLDNEPTLEILECDRQRADMDAVAGLAEPLSVADLAELKAQSEEVREGIRAAFQDILDNEE
jgi:hypothetical protein